MEKNNISEIVRRFLSDRFPRKTEERVQRWMIEETHTQDKERASLEYWDKLEMGITPETYSALERVNR